MTAKNATSCKGKHSGHLCVLVGDGKVETLRDLCDEPKFICFNCGRVANCNRNLCNPMPLKKD
jgi:hypothetical protein